MRVYLLLCFFITSILFSQEEKRLALVIGNSNYDSIADLKNPVNDAKLIAKTLDSLDFDVIEAYDLDFNSFYEKIEDFADKRKKYDVGFFYYAGHGVQIEGDNYLLPTSNSFDRKWKIKSGAIKVNDILEYLTSITDQVNILILDACRNNPLEEASRGSGDSDNDGLAVQKIPTGSIIGYSAESGKRAYDGKGENSFYSLSLSKNMLKENLSIDQVFRNVRTEVLGLSNKRQRPIEQSQLTGQAFYLNPSEYSDLFKKVDSILISDNEQDLYEGLTLIETVINKSTDQISIREALILKARLYSSLKEYKNSEDIFLNLIDQDSLYPETYIQLASLKNEQEQYKKAIELYTKAIEIEPENDNIYFQRTTPYEELEMYAEAVADYKKAIEIDPKYTDHYLGIGNLYSDKLQEYEKAIAEYLKILDFEPENLSALNNIGAVYHIDLKNTKKAEQYYLKVLEIDSLDALTIINLGRLYEEQEQYQKAIKFYTKAIEIEPENDNIYFQRTTPYEELEMYAEAEADYKKAIEIDPDAAYNYLYLGNLYKDEFNEPEKAIAQYLKMLDISPENTRALNNIGITYQDEIKNFEKAKEYYLKSIEIDSTYSNPYFNLGNLYSNLEEHQKAIEFYTKSIKIEPENSYFYYYRATPYESLEMYAEAEADYLKAIELDPEYEDYYLDLGDLYKNQFNNLQRAKKQYLLAIGTYNRRIKKEPKRASYYHQIGEIYSDYLLDFENGLKWTQEGNSLKKTARSLVTEATLYQNLNNFLKAEEKYLEAIELDPKRGNSLFAIANLYMLQKKYLIAEEYVKRSIKASINDPDGYYKLAIIFLKEKDYLNAYEQISFSINKELNNKEGFRILGFDNISILKLEDLYILRSEIAYKLLGKNNKSCEDLNKALELNNDNISIKEKINEICN